MTPLLIALAIAHFSSGLSSETLCETEMICAPPSTAWLMRLAKVLSRPHRSCTCREKREYVNTLGCLLSNLEAADQRFIGLIIAIDLHGPHVR